MSDFLNTYAAPMNHWISPASNGAPILFIHHRALTRGQEIKLAFQWLGNRQLFGRCLDLMMPAIFDKLGDVSGAFVVQEVPSRLLVPDMHFPGDVDALVIPYSDGRLLLSDALAIELKIVRASFQKPSRSPNQWGVSQASAMLQHGFPHVAVVHLIISDSSPQASWKEFLKCKVLDSEGRVGNFEPVMVDPLPMDLIQRSAGRMRVAIGEQENLGWACAYLDSREGAWMPCGGVASRNPRTQLTTLLAIERCFNLFPEAFVNIPCRPACPAVDRLGEDHFTIVDRRKMMASE